MEKKKNDCPNKLLTTLMIVCVTLSIVILGIVSYDKFIKKEEKKTNFVPVQQGGVATLNCENKVNGDKISSLNKLKLTETNKEVTFGSKTYKLRIDSERSLFVDDKKAEVDGLSYEVEYVYLTDKFAFFTSTSQFSDYIAYALGENGNIVVNHNGCQMDNFKIVDGYLHATGGKPVFNGMDFDIAENDLLIKYIDNTLIVTEAK